jgi:hypothetical protein
MKVALRPDLACIVVTLARWAGLVCSSAEGPAGTDAGSDGTGGGA